MGRSDREELIKKELLQAGITVAKKDNSLFPTFGRLGQYDFFRGPWYWLAVGDLPLEVAQKLFTDSELRPFLSVSGLNNKARPDDRRSAASRKKHSPEDDIYVWAKPKTLSSGKKGYFIPFIGITSLDALNFFVQTLKEHQLV